MWTQDRGLPQDTIRAIAQTTDGYLWLGTDEGLARFDGYEFVVFDKAKGNLPDNSITALAAAADGALWIGTPSGLTEFRAGRFLTYSTKSGLPDDAITALCTGRGGALWIVAGVHVVRFQNARFETFTPGRDMPITAARAIYEDPDGELFVAGFNRVVKLGGGRFETVLEKDAVGGMVPLAIRTDADHNLWIAGNAGVIQRTSGGAIRRYGVREGLPDTVVRALWIDRDRNVWAGTNNGMARLEEGRFASSRAADGGDAVRCLLEDREGNLWIGANGGLSRWRSDIFTVYGKSEGLPSDEPNTAFQDRAGRVWIGFNDEGLMLFGGRRFTAADGLPDSEVFQIREAPGGDLLLTTRRGIARFSGGHFRNYSPPDALARNAVFDALEDAAGALWLAAPSGLGVLNHGRFTTVVPSSPLLVDFMVTLGQSADGSIWAGTFGRGLWRVKGEDRRQYTAAQGLSSEQIRYIYQEPGGPLWIATFGGGLNAIAGGHISHYTAADGLLSDNIGNIYDDGESLWLSTTRGICRIPKSQLRDFSQGRRKRLEPENFGVEDGLRSAQCVPGYPRAGGGFRGADGRLWFTTSRGLAVLDPGAHKPPVLAPLVRFVEITSNGVPMDVVRTHILTPGNDRLQIRWTGIHLSAPERVQYSYRLENVDRDWVDAGSRRVINYNNLRHGHYRFAVRASVAGAAASTEAWAFDVRPQFWETAWFRVLFLAALAAVAWGSYRLRLRQVRSRFALVLEERARLAREIHDTLAQGFVGISSQLDAVAMCMPDESAPARSYLDLARRMARHSLTEARRSVMDLRASALEGQDLAAAIETGAKQWAAGSGVAVAVEVSGPVRELPPEMEQHLLRISQEAVTNTLKHAHAGRICVKLHMETRKLRLRIVDDGRGFDQRDAFLSRGGHFGLIGMRERAERLGGELRLASQPGGGTEVEITVPLHE